MKRLLTIAALVAVLGIAAATVLKHADGSRRTFNAFCRAIAAEDYVSAQSYVASGLLGQNSNGVWVVHMINGDMPAARFGKARVKKVRRSKERDVVIFQMSSIGDMAHVEGGQITYIKCP